MLFRMPHIMPNFIIKSDDPIPGGFCFVLFNCFKNLTI